MTSLLTFGMTHFSNFSSTPSSLLLIWYGCESWTIKKAEHQRTDAFKLWCWRRLFRVPWTARRSNQSLLKKINPEHSLERLMAEAAIPILWPPEENWLTGKDPDAGRLKTGGVGDDRGQDGWMVSPTQWTWVWANFQEMVKEKETGVLQNMG